MFGTASKEAITPGYPSYRPNRHFASRKHLKDGQAGQTSLSFRSNSDTSDTHRTNFQDLPGVFVRRQSSTVGAGSILGPPAVTGGDHFA